MYKNKDFYEGWVKDGLRNGKGRLIKANGEVLIGDWEDDQLSGEGSLSVYIDGKTTSSMIMGEFKNSKPHGLAK